MLNEQKRNNIHRLVRAIERFTVPSTRTTVGHFMVQDMKCGIQLIRYNYHPEHSNTMFTTSLSIEIQTTSGLIYVPIGEFGSLHNDSFVDSVPRIRCDKHWISYQTSKKHKKGEMEVQTYIGPSNASRKGFHLKGDNSNEMLDNLESELFQYNLSCAQDEVIDDQLTHECIQFVLEEFDCMYNAETEISCVDVMHTHVSISDGKTLIIPYDKIAPEIEKYVQSH